ncbi:MAG: bile acid:sodium symporter, partial [Bacteroidia bacterium]|nr:bile acid:sodium symporter [Bacteroidia bacterium]
MHQYLPILLRVLVTIMMIGMGVALTLNDFKELRSRGKAVLLGLSIQILALPILALAITQILPLSYEMALGLFLVACCPGGPLSNIFTYLSKGNLALSITLTAIVSILTIVTLPLYLNWYIQFALDSSQSKIAFSMGSTMITMTSLMLLPIICGMALRHYFPKLIKIFDAIIKLTMLVAVPIAMYLAIDSLLDLENIADHLFFTIVGALMLNIVTIIFSFLLS